MAPKYKVTRARSEEKKDLQFEKIIETGKNLFLKKGFEGFSMRNLADACGMTKNNLYNYVSSKRELWLAIRNKFYTQFKVENQEIITNHTGTNTDLIMKLMNHFIEFTERDFGVFLMMFAYTNAPTSKNIGKIEQSYKEFRLLDGTTKLFQRAIDHGELKEKNPAIAALFLSCILFGTMYVDMNRRIKNPVLENIQLSVEDISHEEFQTYVLNIIEKLLTLDLL